MRVLQRLATNSDLQHTRLSGQTWVRRARRLLLGSTLSLHGSPCLSPVPAIHSVPGCLTGPILHRLHKKDVIVTAPIPAFPTHNLLSLQSLLLHTQRMTEDTAMGFRAAIAAHDEGLREAYDAYMSGGLSMQELSSVVVSA